MSFDSNIELQRLKKLNTLPKDLNISTITLCFKFCCEFNVKNIHKYVDQSLIKKEEKKKKVKKKKKRNREGDEFYNQISLLLATPSYIKAVSNSKNKKKKGASVKIFSNGSIQITGCRNYDNFEEIIQKLCSELGKKKAIIDPFENKIIDKPFVSDYNLLKRDLIHNFRISMINADYNVGFNIDRNTLYNILEGMKIKCTFEPIKHAGVNIKHYNGEKSIAIFVFETGHIIITSARRKEDIVSAYKFINKILHDNFKKIALIDFDSFLKEKEIKELCEEYKKYEEDFDNINVSNLNILNY